MNLTEEQIAESDARHFRAWARSACDTYRRARTTTGDTLQGDDYGYIGDLVQLIHARAYQRPWADIAKALAGKPVSASLVYQTIDRAKALALVTAVRDMRAQLITERVAARKWPSSGVEAEAQHAAQQAAADFILRTDILDNEEG